MSGPADSGYPPPAHDPTRRDPAGFGDFPQEGTERTAPEPAPGPAPASVPPGLAPRDVDAERYRDDDGDTDRDAANDRHADEARRRFVDALDRGETVKCVRPDGGYALVSPDDEDGIPDDWRPVATSGDGPV